MKIICILTNPESGKPKVFNKEYVDRLYEGIKKHTTREYEFICYTDLFVDIYTKPLKSNLPGWWGKPTLFGREELVNVPVLYIDLDTIIIDSIDEICDYVNNSTGFTILRDFYRSDGYGSGLMAWNGDYRYIWENFKLDAVNIMNRLGGIMGDQWFLQEQVKKAEIWQDKLPNKIVSYKVHCLQGKPEGASIVCFHGLPRPHEVGWNVL